MHRFKKKLRRAVLMLTTFDGDEDIHRALEAGACGYLLKSVPGPELLRAIDGYQGSPVTFGALRLAPLLFQRPGELRAAEWSELDLDAAEWRTPAARQKIKKADKENPRTPPHVVPLPSQAVAILRELELVTGAGRLLFPGLRTPTRPMSENTVNGALRRLGYTTEQMTGHGFRHMASTRLNELGWNPDAIERQLSHRAELWHSG